MAGFRLVTQAQASRYIIFTFPDSVVGRSIPSWSDSALAGIGAYHFVLVKQHGELATTTPILTKYRATPAFLTIP